jgi:hypothetical protein
MNLTLESKKLEQAFEAMKEKQLDERTREILHDLGIPLIMPTQQQLNLKQALTPFKSQNKTIPEQRCQI